MRTQSSVRTVSDDRRRTTTCTIPKPAFCASPRRHALRFEWRLEETLEEGARHVQLTGGEPLLQRAAPLLMRMLSDAGFTVLLETSGGVSTERVDPRVITILDVKTPGSGEHERSVWKNLERLRAHDEVKFVITSADDDTFGKRVVDENALPAKCAVLFSPSFPGLAPVTLAHAKRTAWMRARDRDVGRLTDDARQNQPYG